MGTDVTARADFNRGLDPPHGWEALAETASPDLLQRRGGRGPFHMAGKGRSTTSFDVRSDSWSPAGLSSYLVVAEQTAGTPVRGKGGSEHLDRVPGLCTLIKVGCVEHLAGTNLDSKQQKAHPKMRLLLPFRE